MCKFFTVFKYLLFNKHYYGNNMENNEMTNSYKISPPKNFKKVYVGR